MRVLLATASRHGSTTEIGETLAGVLTLDRKALSFGEKAIVVALRAPEGDFRDFDEIREWATTIAAELER